jgi:hypothetical protein
MTMHRVSGRSTTPTYLSASSSADNGRLVSVRSNGRPLYGNVYVQDGYGGFKRELEQDRRRAALGAARV